MKKIISVLIIIISISLGLYVGVWLLFAGGIIQIVNSINPLNGGGIALGIVKIIFCEIAVVIPVIGFGIASVINN